MSAVIDPPVETIEKHFEELDTVTIRFAGDSGDGMQLTGTQFTNTSAIIGNDISTLPDFPAEIRAPAGSLPGVSGFQLNFSSHDIRTPGDQPNVLVAMNPAALKVNLPDLEEGGTLIINSDEFTKEKVRHKPNGYAIIEDIPKIPVRPRINFVAPTYSAIELVQGLGRCPRLTSLSNTIQRLIYYSGTVEVDVARIVSAKLRCLTKVVRMRESWHDVIVGQTKAETHINNTANVVDNPDDMVSGEEGDEE